MEETLEMVRMAEEQGIGRFIVTPHFSRQFLNDNPKMILQLCQEVQENIWKTIGKDKKIVKRNGKATRIKKVSRAGEMNA